MGLTTKGRDQGTDLTNAYIHLSQHPGTDVLDVAGALGTGARTAREIIGVLINAGLVAETENLSGYRVINSVDMTRDAVMAWIEARGATSPVTEPKLQSNQVTHPCRCGCGVNTNHPDSRYLPGHDARHAGAVARSLVAKAKEQELSGAQVAATLTEQLQTEALVTKAHALFLRWSQAPAAKRSHKPAAERRIVNTHEVRVGRWTYPARTWSVGSPTTERNSKRDGSGEWLPVN